MPLYEYRCSQCGTVFEIIQKFSDEPLKEHTGCGGAVERLVSAPALQFKGSGFYINDYAKSGSGSQKGGSSGSGGESKGGESKGDSSSSSSSSGSGSGSDGSKSSSSSSSSGSDSSSSKSSSSSSKGSDSK